MENAIPVSRKQTIENISENKIGSSLRSLEASESSRILGLQDYEYDLMGYDDLASQMASPKLSNKMQMILQSNVNLSESIIQNTYKAVDASRIKLENKDLQVELEITELKLHHLDKKMEECLQSSKNTLNLNAKVSENVSKMFSPLKSNSSIILPELKPRDSDRKVSGRGGSDGSSSFNPTYVRTSPSNKKIHPASLISKLESISNESNNLSIAQQQQLHKGGLENEGQKKSAHKLKSPSIENFPQLEMGSDNSNINPLYFTFNQRSNLSVPEFDQEPKKMALPQDPTGVSSSIVNNGISTSVQRGTNVIAVGPLKTSNLNEEEISQQIMTTINKEVEAFNNKMPSQRIGGTSMPKISREITLRDQNGKEVVYIIKPKPELSFEKLETISVSFQRDEKSPSEQNKSKNMSNSNNPKSWAQAFPYQNQESVKPSTNSAHYFINIPTLPSEHKDRSEILSIVANEKIEQSYQEELLNGQDKSVFSSLKYQLLNQPKYQQIIYGDNNYSVTARSLQKNNKPESPGEQRSQSKPDIMMKQKIQE